MSGKNLLTNPVINRMRYLLDMLYSPAQFAEATGLDQRNIYRSLIPAGLPTRKDDKGHVWIHGTAAAAWAAERTNERQHHAAHLAKDEAYCAHCKAPRKINEAQRRTLKNGAAGLAGTCDTCGGRVFKITEGRKRQ